MTVGLTILAWDDPRATAPLRAAIAAYCQVEPGTSIALTTRPLASFNDEPIEDTAARADLVVFDHPMVPRAAEIGALRPLDDLLATSADGGSADGGSADGGSGDDGSGDSGSADRSTVGGSAGSYRWAGRTWGVALDAACQVTAVRQDLLALLGAAVPESVDGLLAFADDHPGRVAVPLYPSDAICTLMTLSVAHARAAGEPDTWLRRDAVEVLCALIARVDPRSAGRNPPAILAAMQAEDDWALAPFTFGYANAARRTGTRALTWHDLPTVRGARASILGGAGLGISAATDEPNAAGRFVRWCSSTDVQRTIAVPNGGQPASRAVWDDPAADSLAAGFFTGTRRTMSAAFIRPRSTWWPELQHLAGRALAQRLAEGTAPARIHDELRLLHDRYDDSRHPADAGRDEELR